MQRTVWHAATLRPKSMSGYPNRARYVGKEVTVAASDTCAARGLQPGDPRAAASLFMTLALQSFDGDGAHPWRKFPRHPTSRISIAASVHQYVNAGKPTFQSNDFAFAMNVNA